MKNTSAMLFHYLNLHFHQIGVSIAETYTFFRASKTNLIASKTASFQIQ